jgi:glycosyltransferase involved in cell wall biosynthesis
MISVLMPVYNTKAVFLRECIESCLLQTIDNYEVIIVDNESKNPETIRVLKEAQKDKKIKIFQCPRQKDKKNLSLALNYGLKKCKYNLVARMDSDDIMFHDRLEKQYNHFLRNTSTDILGGQIKIIPTNHETTHPLEITTQIALSSYWFINHPTVMFKKDKILSLGGYKDTPELFAEDYDLWLRALGMDMKVKNLKECILFYRSHGENLTKQTEKNPNYYSIMNESRENLRKNINGNS